MDAAWNQIIPGALGRAFDQHGRLNLQKILLIQEISYRLCHLMAQQEILLQPRPAQIQIAIF